MPPTIGRSWSPRVFTIHSAPSASADAAIPVRQIVPTVPVTSDTSSRSVSVKDFPLAPTARALVIQTRARATSHVLGKSDGIHWYSAINGATPARPNARGIAISARRDGDRGRHSNRRHLLMRRSRNLLQSVGRTRELTTTHRLHTASQKMRLVANSSAACTLRVFIHARRPASVSEVRRSAHAISQATNAPRARRVGRLPRPKFS